ncbi:MAG: hypothetical protein DYG89_47660 [Caldilinea sp. CFX5]|nr:hypothetical protein [Caldilinea sp. CFX5]
MSVTQPMIRPPTLETRHQNGASFTADWLHDPLEALGRPLGPYTVDDMERYLRTVQRLVGVAGNGRRN